jgi:hypothetical protein
VETAYSEARLYALEINSGFPSGLNPCCRIIATNGLKLLAGNWDSEPLIRLEVQELEVGTANFDQFLSLASDSVLSKIAEKISEEIKVKDFKRPIHQGAGQTLILSRIEPNTFAADLTPVLRKYFSSQDHAKDQDIYSRAYVSSNEVTSYDKILESFLKDRLSRAKRRTQITTTKNKSETITKALSSFDVGRPATGSMQLVIGGVGVGKSLFARRYKEFLQPDNLREKDHWAFLNFNNAPEDVNRWESWVCDEFAKSIVEEGAPIDFRLPEDQERVFASDLADRKAFYDRMEAAQPSRGALERARDIEQWRLDSLKLTLGTSRYLQGDKGENIIVVFDNVDRRDSTAQLAAFQTALWFMEQTRSFVILQMRDTTFENYKHKPPLDTYRTGQIFHISPPRFIDVVKKRLELSLEALQEEAPELVKYFTKTGMAVTYPKSWAGGFLRGIYNELFLRPNNLSRVLEALAGRNVRKALDMFMAILTSGHMPEETIASVAQGTGFRSFPEFRTIRALMRQDYRFFSDRSGFIANIFSCEGNWERPSNLLVPELLFYLIGQRKVRGDNGQIGFVAISKLLAEMEARGFVKSDVKDAAHFCLKKELVETETSSQDVVSDSASLKATASGWAHMRILASRMEYIAAVLPTTPMNDKQLSARVYESMQTENRVGQLSFHTAVGLVDGFHKYLQTQEKAQNQFLGNIHSQHSGSKYILGKMEEALNFARREDAKVTGQPDLLDY